MLESWDRLFGDLASYVWLCVTKVNKQAHESTYGNVTSNYLLKVTVTVTKLHGIKVTSN